MQRESSLVSLSVLGSLSVLLACSTGNNDVGSLPRDGGGTGGVLGSGTGGTQGGGGATASLTCTYNGKTYAAGESFKVDCNTCSCGAFGDTVVRCTAMACLGTGGGPAGTGGLLGSGGPAGTGGLQGSGGVAGTGGITQVLDSGVDSVDASEPSYCSTCVDETAAKVLACPPQRPTTVADLEAICQQYSDHARTVRLGGCGVWTPLPGCSSTSPDPTVDVLSVDFLVPSGLDCQYSRATGMLVGQSVSSDAPRYCGGQAYVAATAGVTNAWCRSTSVLSVTCGGSGYDGGVDGGAIDSSVASACSECGADELCVAYYDGMCTAMGVSCNKVSATTRESILVNHERCFGKAIGDEICGTRDGLHFWGCGEPSCGKDKETLLSDINCYGP